jgi:Ca-activated chloride channel family protein
MKWRLTTAMGAALALCAGIHPAARSSQQATFRSGIDVVNIDVSVKSGDAAVSGLTVADFELTDNGVPQKLDAATIETLPIDVTLLLDMSLSVDGATLDRLKSSVRETAALLRPIDRLRLLGIHESITQVFDWQPGGMVPALEGLRGEGGTALFDGIVAALIRPAEPQRRQLIVMLTDGDERLSILDTDKMRDVASHTEAVVDVIVPMAKIMTTKPELAPLTDVATHTGGRLFPILLTDSLSAAFTRSIGDFRTSYLLRYVPQGVARPGWHTVNVRVTKPGAFELHARKGYSGG